MNLSAHVLPEIWLLTGIVAYGALVLWALAGIDRRRLQREPHRQHLLLASSVAVMVLWLVRSSVVMPEIGLHVLGMTALTLLVGWRQALVGSLFPVLGPVLVGTEPWQMVGLSGLALAALPIGVTNLVWRITERLLPHNLFVYLFVCALCGSALAAALARLAAMALLAIAGTYTIAAISQDHLVLLSLLLLPESLVNVAAVATLAAWRPQWLITLRPNVT